MRKFIRPTLWNIVTKEQDKRWSKRLKTSILNIAITLLLSGSCKRGFQKGVSKGLKGHLLQAKRASFRSQKMMFWNRGCERFLQQRRNKEDRKRVNTFCLPYYFLLYRIKSDRDKPLTFSFRTRNQHRCACYLRGNSTRNRGQLSWCRLFQKHP